MKKLIQLVLLLSAGITASAQGWWMKEPVSLIQTNLRETDSDLDPKALVEKVKKFPANTILFSVGGITAHYPTKVQYHYKSDYLPAGKDLVGDVIRESHKENIRVIARFDFSRARKEVFDAHPEWFIRKKDGGPIVDENGLHNICINSGYYNVKAIEILTEVLEQYDVDGMFFNWFGNNTNDYYGRYIGLCHCDTCESRFKQQYGRAVPDDADAEYRVFIAQSAADVAKKFRDLIHAKRPKALFMTYIEEYTDAIVSEADFYKWRPLPQWIYSASEPVNTTLNARPGKMAISLVMPYQEMPYRFASTAGPGLRALLYQNMANGAFPAFVVLGTMDQPDMTALKAVQPVFRFYEKHKQDYVAQQSAARVILYGKSGQAWIRGSGDYRGFFRLLTELHIPFKIMDNVEGLKPADIDLVIVPEGPAPEALQSYVNAGGSVLITGTKAPGLITDKPVKLWEKITSAYMRLSDYKIFPSLQDTKVVFCEGDYLEMEPSPTPVTLIPPGQFGPPDKVATLDIKTDKPGLVLKHIGQGQVAFIPWHIGDLYYRFSNDKHRLFVSDLIDHILPQHQRQLITNVHPAVEITVMKQPATKRTLVHLVNMVGHSGTAFNDAVEIKNINIRLKGNYLTVFSIDGKKPIPVKISGGYTQFIIPSLKEYYGLYLNTGK